MRVVVLGRTSEIGPSTRYRFAQFRELLAAEGITLEIRPLFGATWFRILRVRPRWLGALLKLGYAPVRLVARIVQLATLSEPDVLIVEHQLFPYLPASFERALLARRNYALEFDDAIWLTPLHAKKLEMLCRNADLVIVGNSHLAAFARAWNPRVTVIPTAIDTSRSVAAAPRAEPPSAARPFVIGWIGLPYNFPSLEALAGPLARLARTIPLVLRVVSAGRPRLRGVPLECVPWSDADEARAIATFDVGVMPLPDDAWSRGKCALKVLQYFAAALPVVASPVGMNEEVIEDGVNGLFAATPDEWHDRLLALTRDAQLRARLGAAGRATVTREFDVRVVLPRIVSAWRAAAAGRTAR